MFKKLLTHINFPSFLLSTYTIRLLITGASIGDSIALIGLLGLYGFTYFLQDKKEVPVNDIVKKDLETLAKEVMIIKNSLLAKSAATQIKPGNYKF